MVATAAGWGNEAKIYTSSRDFGDAMWLEARRQGVSLYNVRDEPFQPSEYIQQARNLEEIQERREVAKNFKASMLGDKEATKWLADRKETDLLSYKYRLEDDDRRNSVASFGVGGVANLVDYYREEGRKLRTEHSSYSDQAANTVSGIAESDLNDDYAVEDDDDYDGDDDYSQVAREISDELDLEESDPVPYEDELDLDAYEAHQQRQREIEADPNYGF
jgi:hypothetical protein